MANNPKIVDAEAVSVPATTSMSQSVPVKLDATQMGKMLQEATAKAMANAAQQTPVERINPSTFMRDMSTEIELLYKRFDTLKLLAAELNGLSTDEQLPPQVIFKGLTLDFAISKDNKVADHSVKIQSLSCIGDISNLMSNEFGFIIASLRELSKQVADLAQKTNERCTSAFKEWEASNSNKQVVPTAEQTAPDAVTAAETVTQTQ
jgi:hypothetical protein